MATALIVIILGNHVTVARAWPQATDCILDATAIPSQARQGPQLGTAPIANSEETLSTAIGLENGRAVFPSGFSPSASTRTWGDTCSARNTQLDDTPRAASGSESGSLQTIAGPYLAFSDLVAGANTGNSDTSKGLSPNVNGSLVTLWGLNLGTSQGTSTLTVGGIITPAIYYWGDAVPPWSPANLHNGYQKMQEIIFQVPGTVRVGWAPIVVTVGGRASNELPFSVYCGTKVGVRNTCGHTYFVAPHGNDSAAGSFSAPWATIGKAMSVVRAGDVTYVKQGASAGTTGGLDCHGGQVCLGLSGTSSQPIALVTYPGASVTLGNAGTANLQNTGTTAVGWDRPIGVTHQNTVLSKFHLLGGQLGTVLFVVGTNQRIVGNTISDPTGNLDAGAVSVNGSNIYFLGNELTNNGLICSPLGTGRCPSGDNQWLYHVLYITGARDTPSTGSEHDRWFEWNYLHDNNATRGFNVFQYVSGAFSDSVGLQRIDHNVIVNQYGDGIQLNGLVGDNWVYDNLLVNVGLGVKPGTNTLANTGSDYAAVGKSGDSDNATQHVAIQLANGDGSTTRYHVYNNTIYNAGCANGCNVRQPTGIFYFHNSGSYILDVHNNIGYETNPAIGYISGDYSKADATKLSHNLYYGAASGTPAWDTTSTESVGDPRFLSNGSNFRLRASSPAIDSGSNLGASFVTRDLDGTPQPANSVVDRGAYENILQ